MARPQPGLISIAGGKYTTYRVMAKDAVDAAQADLPGIGAAQRHRATSRSSAPRATTP